jgi:hypothetical protein
MKSPAILSALMLAFVASAAVSLVVAPPAEAQQKNKEKREKERQPIVAHPPEYTAGYVKEYDLKSRTLTLNTGGQYRLAAPIANTAHASGEKVKLRWTLQSGHRYVDEVVVMIPAPPQSAAAAAAPPAPAPATTDGTLAPAPGAKPAAPVGGQ